MQRQGPPPICTSLAILRTQIWAKPDIPLNVLIIRLRLRRVLYV
uniref:Uncharacterized protein n=1 Tax=Nelumbo nucifera TaxID=4432 RepID=A0A822ZQK9_NELNU|nr:TPA_asm: hypothetical protein HUJ06_017459 [Nelumbo nucifera]